MSKKKRKHRNKRSRILELKVKFAFGYLLVGIAIAALVILGIRFLAEEVLINTEIIVVDRPPEPTPTPEPTPEPVEEEGVSFIKFDLAEKEIYTFSQGPVAWNGGLPYSGSWAEMTLADNRFSVFGCGLCAMANIYSTLSPYRCSPVDMFEYAREVSSYSPSAGYGAIDWGEMRDTLEQAGFTCELFEKADSYEEFCEQVYNSNAAIMLVSNETGTEYWYNTEGHYVNAWSFDPESQTFFLGDSGNPAHNRQWISMRTLYDALKTSSAYQYLLVYMYDEDLNGWKHHGISQDWVAP